MQDSYIDTPEGLARLAESLRGSPWIALDTEFMREKTYFPQLCLLQVATPTVVACVDPLRLDDLTPLLDVIFDPAIIKVMHAARQDMEILLLLRGSLPAPVFDTQLAGTVLGFGDQVGYGAMVKQVLGVELDKAHARADWARRPLEPEQIHYAADDVRYLGRVYETIVAQLEEKDRMGWLREDFAQLADAGSYRTLPEEAWLRIKGAGKLKGVQFAVLRALAAWREEHAVKVNRPRRWLLKDELLIDMAKLMPDSLPRLEKMRGIEASALVRHGAELVAVIVDAKRTPREQWPNLELSDRLTPEQESVADLLAGVLRQIGADQGVSPTAIATRRELEQVVLGLTDVPVLHGWRAAVAGNTLREVALGRLQVRVADGVLRLEPAL